MDCYYKSTLEVELALTFHFESFRSSLVPNPTIWEVSAFLCSVSEQPTKYKYSFLKIVCVQCWDLTHYHNMREPECNPGLTQVKMKCNS